MKKATLTNVITGLVVAFLVLASSLAFADPGYGDSFGPSTGLTLGEWGSEWGGSEGYIIAEPFQLNLLYQEGILDADIDAINKYDPYGTWDANFSDNDEYVMNIYLNPGGHLPVYTYPDGEDASDPSIQWTLTGWHQTILAGDIVEGKKDCLLLRVLPFTTYRPFINDPPVNDVEIFDGNVDCEVIGYKFCGDLEDIGTGTVLEVVLRPGEKSDCEEGGWEALGFRNQGQCVKYYNLYVK